MSSSFRVASISPRFAGLTAVILLCCAIRLFVSPPVCAQDPNKDPNAHTFGFDVAKNDFAAGDPDRAKDDGNPGVTAYDFYKLLDNSIGDKFSGLILVFGGCYTGDFSTMASGSKIATKPVAILAATGDTKDKRSECTPSLDGDNPFLTGVTGNWIMIGDNGNLRDGTATEAFDGGKQAMTGGVNQYNGNPNTKTPAVASTPTFTAFPNPTDPNSAGRTLTLGGPPGGKGGKYAIIFMGKPQSYYDWNTLQAQYQSLINAGYDSSHIDVFFGTGKLVQDGNDRGSALLTNAGANDDEPGTSVAEDARKRGKDRNGNEPSVNLTFVPKGLDDNAQNRKSLPIAKAATFGNLKMALSRWKRYAEEDKDGVNQYFILIGTHSTQLAHPRPNNLEISQSLLPNPTPGPFYVGGAPTPAPPTDRSLSDLGGKPQLFVAGEVSSQDQMLVTLRGTNTIEGVVVSAEANGRKTEARTNSKGQAILDIAAIAGDAASLAMGTIRALDAGGRQLAQEPTKITPTTSNAGATTAGASTVATRPEVPTLGLLRNGGVVTIPGKNLGSESVLVVGNRAQETLSASSKELTSFIDAPALGPQPAYVRNSHGSSPTQTVHCYNFTVAASQTTIVRGQHIMVTGQYEGLPPGSQIEFTNATPTVVKMNVQGGRNHGEQGSCTVSKTAGTCEVDLTGRSQGAFVINYKVEPPR